MLLCYNAHMKNSIVTSCGIVEFAVKRKNIKSIRLKVTGDSKVEVSAPFGVSDSVIQRFVQDHSGFVEERLSAVNYTRAASYPEEYKSGDMFTLLGRRAVLNVEQAQRNTAKLSGSVLTMKVTDPDDEDICQRAFESWTRRYAGKVFEERLRAILPQFNRLAGKDIRISVRDMKTRWGSIIIKKDTMSLSVHLLRCEIELIDHIIIHELCHYAHANHSGAFYAELAKYSPDYKRLQKRLKDYGMVGF